MKYKVWMQLFDLITGQSKEVIEYVTADKYFIEQGYVTFVKTTPIIGIEYACLTLSGVTRIELVEHTFEEVGI